MVRFVGALAHLCLASCSQPDAPGHCCCPAAPTPGPLLPILPTNATAPAAGQTAPDPSLPTPPPHPTKNPADVALDCDFAVIMGDTRKGIYAVMQVGSAGGGAARGRRGGGQANTGKGIASAHFALPRAPPLPAPCGRCTSATPTPPPAATPPRRRPWTALPWATARTAAPAPAAALVASRPWRGPLKASPVVRACAWVSLRARPTRPAVLLALRASSPPPPHPPTHRCRGGVLPGQHSAPGGAVQGRPGARLAGSHQGPHHHRLRQAGVCVWGGGGGWQRCSF